MGCIFRLIMNRFVSPSAKHVLYLDTDAMIMVNL